MAKRRRDLLPGVTVITPTLPERREMLEECKASVRAQTVQPYAHLIAADPTQRGVSFTLNRLWPETKTKWVSILADDDTFDPTFLERLLVEEAMHPGFDVYYTWCRTEGLGGYDPNRPYDGDFTDVPVNGLFSRDLIRALKGWRSLEIIDGGPDIDFLRRAQQIGATFRCVEEPLWTWRFHGRNLCRHEGGRV